MTRLTHPQGVVTFMTFRKMRISHIHRPTIECQNGPEYRKSSVEGTKNADVGFVLERSFCFELDRLVGWLPEVVLPNHDQN